MTSKRFRRLLGSYVVALLCGVAGGALLWAGSPAHAATSCDIATIRWDGGAGTVAWHDAGNWDLNRVPGTLDHACIPDMTPDVTVIVSTSTQVLSLEALETVRVTGTLSMTSSTQASSIVRLELSGGTIDGLSALTVPGSLAWTGGTMTGNGSTTVPLGSALSIDPSSSVTLRGGRTLTTAGDTSWIRGTFSMGESADWVNSGTVTVAGDYSFSYFASPAPLVSNTGTFAKTAGTGSNGLYVGVPFENLGTVRADAGRVRLVDSGGRTQTGRFDAAGAGTFVNFESGSFTLSPAAILAGEIQVTGSSLTVQGTFDLPKLIVSSGTLTLSNAAASQAASLTLSGGTIAGAGPLNVPGSLTWTSGTMTGTGTTTVPLGSALTIDAPSSVTLRGGRTLSVAANTSWLRGTFSIGESAVWRNTGTATVAGDLTLSNFSSPPPLVTNSGTFVKTVGTSTGGFYVGVPFENLGTVRADAGRVRLVDSGGRMQTGSFDAAGAGTFMSFESGSFTLSSAATLAGDIRVSGSSLTVQGTFNLPSLTVSSGTLTLSGTTPSQAAALTFSGGSVAGTGSLTVPGSLSWTAGTMTGTGTTTIPLGASLSIDASSVTLSSGRTLITTGNTSWLRGTVSMSSSATWRNSGTVSVAGDLTVSNSGSPAPLLTNTGTFAKTAGTSTSGLYVGVPFENLGTVRADAGRVRLADSGGYMQTGRFDAAGAATLVNFESGSFLLSPAAVLTGEVHVTGSSVTLQGTFDLPRLTVSSGTLTLSSASASQAAALTFSGGTIAGTGSLNVPGSLSWTSGTMTGTGTTTVPLGASLGIDASSVTLSSGRTLTTAGNTSWVRGTISMSQSATWRNSGEVTVAGDLTLSNSGSPSPLVTNTGTFAKTAGISTTGFYVGVPFENLGTLRADAGRVRLVDSGGRTQTGRFDAAGAATFMNFESGSFTLSPAATLAGELQVTGSSLTVQGSFDLPRLVVSSGTLTLPTAGTTSQAQAVTFSGGTIAGTGSLTVPGSLSWTSGTMTGTGTTTVPLGASLSIDSSSVTLTSSRALVTAGNTNWVRGTISMSGAATWRNSGTVTVAGDLSLSGSGSPSPLVTNTGTFVKTAGASTSGLYVSAPFENLGTLRADTGRVRLVDSGGRTQTGRFDAAGTGSLMIFESGTFLLSPAAVLTGEVHVTGTALTVQGSFDLPRMTVSSGSLTLPTAATSSQAAVLNFSGGTIGGVGALTVPGTLTWTSGTMTGTGITTLPTGARLNLRGSVTLRGGRQLVNNGTVVWGSGSPSVYEGALFRNAGTLDVQGDFYMYTSSGTGQLLQNTGTIRKSAGTSPSGLYIGVPFENSGTVVVEAGQLRLIDSGGRIQTGRFVATEPGAKLVFDGGTFALSDAASLVGDVSVNGSTVSVASAVDLPRLSLTSGSLTLTSAADSVAGRFTFSGGTFAGTSNLTASNLTWTGGTMTGAGTTTVPAGGTLTIGGGVSLRGGRQLVNRGSAIWGAGTPYIYEGAVLHNAGGLEVQGDFYVYNSSGAAPLLKNTGTITKSAGTGGLYIGVPFENAGTLEARMGQVRFVDSGGRAQSGVFRSTGPGRLDFESGSFTLTPEAGLEGHVAAIGSSLVVNAPVDIPRLTMTSGTLTLGAPSAVESLTMSGGTLTGAGNLDVQTMSWTGGTMSGLGRTTVPSGGTLTIGGGVTLRGGRQLTNSGAAVWGAGSPYIYEGAVFQNAGTLDVQGDFNVYNSSGAAPLLQNTGTITKSAGTGAMYIGVPFENAGTLRTTTGRIRLVDSGGRPQTGRFEAAGAGTRVDFESGTFVLSPAAVISGDLALTGGNLSFEGRLDVPSVAVSSGTLTLNSTAAVSRVENMSMSGGTLAGAGTLSVSRELSWSGGTMSGAGTTTVSRGALLFVNGSVSLRSGRVLVNEGTGALGAGSMSVYEASVLRNSGTFEVQGDFPIYGNCCAAPIGQIHNTGTFTKTGGAGRASIDMLFDNDGTVGVRAGELQLAGPVTNYSSLRRSLSGGRWELEGSLRLESTDIAINAADIVLDGSEARILDRTAADALRALARNAAGGSLTLRGGRSHGTASPLTNEGTISVGDGSSLSSTGTFTQVSGRTTLETAASSLSALGLDVAGGVLAGSGLVDGSLTNSGGVVSPQGSMRVAGEYMQRPGGILRVSLGPSGADRLDAGVATMDGTLRVAVGLVLPPGGLEFSLVRYSSHSGRFSRVQAETLPATFEDRYGPTEMTLLASPAPLGGSISANGGAEATASASVTLTLDPPEGATGMRLANEAAPQGDWEAVRTSMPWTLLADEGLRTVYVQFLDSGARETQVASDSIVLDLTAPAATILEPAAGVATVVFSEDVRGVGGRNYTVRVSGSPADLPAELRCFNDVDVETDCSSGRIRRAELRPAVPLVPAVSYVVSVNPDGADPVRDIAGNAAGQTSRTAGGSGG